MILSSFLLLGLLAALSHSFPIPRQHRQHRLQVSTPLVRKEPESDFQVVGNFTVNQPSFLYLLPRQQGKEVKDLYISSFGASLPWQKDHDKVYRIQNFSYDSVFKSKGSFAVNPVKVPKSGNPFVWPNEVQTIAPGMFGDEHKEGVIVAGGFLVPFKTHGGLWFVDVRAGHVHDTYLLTNPAESWFYHRVAFMDVNQDGRPDIITCRAHVGFPTKSELVWMQPKDAKNPFDKWEVKVLSKSCDVYFRVQDLNGDGIPEILAAQFFSKRLNLIYTTHPQGRWDDASFIKTRVVDDSLGKPYDILIDDFNLDGRMDVVVNNHQGPKDKIPPSIFSYDVPTDLVRGKWTRKTISTDFTVVAKGIMPAGPGTMKVHRPKSCNGNPLKPVLIVAGDGTHKVHMITARNNMTSSWDYETTVLYDCGCTSAGLVVDDLSGDERPELLIPCYEKGFVVGGYLK